MAPKLILGTEDKRLNVIIKDSSPIALILQVITKVLGPVSQEAWMKTKHISYKSHHRSTFHLLNIHWAETEILPGKF